MMVETWLKKMPRMPGTAVLKLIVWRDGATLAAKSRRISSR